jgi:predicted HTH transcriptional regulator
VILVELLKRTEGKTLEFKRDLSSPEGILKCLVAFANTAGGIVVIGVEDGSKNVLATEEKLANLVSDSIRPRLIPDIEVVAWRNLNVLAVQVYPSNTRPHYLERLGPEDGVFIRVGSTNRKAEALQIEELKRLNWRTTFDEQAIPDLKSEAIDFRAASELFAPYRQLTAQAWSTLRVTTEHQGRQVPTIGGLLLFGKDRFARFPDAWIQAGRFAGINRARLLD